MWDGVARGLGEAPAGMVQAWAHWRFYFRRAKAQGFPRTPPGSPAAPRAPPPGRADVAAGVAAAWQPCVCACWKHWRFETARGRERRAVDRMASAVGVLGARGDVGPAVCVLHWQQYVRFRREKRRRREKARRRGGGELGVFAADLLIFRRHFLGQWRRHAAALVREREQEEAAVLMQRHIRGQAARRKVERAKAAKAEEFRLEQLEAAVETQKEHDAVTMIARMWRGKKERRVFDKRRRDPFERIRRFNRIAGKSTNTFVRLKDLALQVSTATDGAQERLRRAQTANQAALGNLRQALDRLKAQDRTHHRAVKAMHSQKDLILLQEFNYGHSPDRFRRQLSRKNLRAFPAFPTAGSEGSPRDGPGPGGARPSSTRATEGSVDALDPNVQAPSWDDLHRMHEVLKRKMRTQGFNPSWETKS